VELLDTFKMRIFVKKTTSNAIVSFQDLFFSFSVSFMQPSVALLFLVDLILV